MNKSFFVLPGVAAFFDLFRLPFVICRINEESITHFVGGNTLTDLRAEVLCTATAAAPAERPCLGVHPKGY